MMPKRTHWAAELIGRPYEPGAAGPDTFSCWGLVRWVSALRGKSLPPLGDTDAVLEHARATGWRKLQASAAPEADDVALLRGGLPGLHCGWMLRIGGLLHLLHAESGRGAVVVDRWEEITAGRRVELWRCAA